MNKNPIIIIGPITILNNKFDIKKYGLNVFKLYIAIGNINIWTEIDTEIISFILSKEFCIFGFIKYLYFLFFTLIFFNIDSIVLFNRIIPITPPYDNNNPKLWIKKGL